MEEFGIRVKITLIRREMTGSDLCSNQISLCPLSFEIRRSGWHLKVWVGREEVILHLWPIYISHKFLDAAAAAVLGSTILWEVLLRMRASKVVQW